MKKKDLNKHLEKVHQSIEIPIPEKEKSKKKKNNRKSK